MVRCCRCGNSDPNTRRLWAFGECWELCVDCEESALREWSENGH